MGTRLANKAWTQLYTFLSTAGGKVDGPLTVSGGLTVTGGSDLDTLSVSGQSTLDGTTVTTPPTADDSTSAANTEWVNLQNYGHVDWVPYTVGGQSFAANDMTRDGAWTMIAKVATTDRPAPQPSGPDTDLLPVWTPATQNARASYTVWNEWTLSQAGWIGQYGVDIVNGNLGMTHALTLTINGTVEDSHSIAPDAVGLYLRDMTPILVTSGAVVRVTLTVTQPSSGNPLVFWFAGAGLFATAPTYCSLAQGSKDGAAAGTTAYGCHAILTPGAASPDWDIVAYGGAAAGGAGAEPITLSGDVTGSGVSTIAATVTGLQGHPVATTAPTSGQALEWNGTAWAPATPAGGGTVTSVTAGTGLTGGTITTTGTLGLSVPVAIANGGTNAATAAAACTNLGALPLAGGTLTGALGGTSANFSSTINATAGLSSGANISATGYYLYLGGSSGTVNGNGGSFLYGDGTNTVVHMGPSGSNTGNWSVQNGVGTQVFAVSGAGNATLYNQFTATGAIISNATLQSLGASAGLIFADRSSTGNSWQWFAQGSTAFLYSTEATGGANSLLSWDASGNMSFRNTSQRYLYFCGQGGNPSLYTDTSNWVSHLGSGNGGFYYQNAGSTNVFQIDGNTGNTNAYGISYAASFQQNSDERLKTNIADSPVGDALALLRRLRMISYDVLDRVGEAPPRHVSLGFSAQQLREVIPEAVSEDGGSYPPVGEQAAPVLSIDLMAVVAHLVRATQQLAARVETLEAA